MSKEYIVKAMVEMKIEANSKNEAVDEAIDELINNLPSAIDEIIKSVVALDNGLKINSMEFSEKEIEDQIYRAALRCETYAEIPKTMDEDVDMAMMDTIKSWGYVVDQDEKSIIIDLINMGECE